MKRKFINALTILLLGSYPLFAQEEPNMADYLLIDFSSLAPGYQPEPEDIYQRQVDPLPLEEGSDSTVVKFTGQQAALSAEEGEAMKDSLALDRWQIDFSPSSRWLGSIVNSYVVAYTLRDSATMYAGEHILAARIHFTAGRFNTRVRIRPPFPIPAYSKPADGVAANELNTSEDPWGQFLHRGVLRNVGNIRSVSAWVYGRNQPLELDLRLHHEVQGKMDIPLGSLQFNGWRKLTWINPSYIQDVRKREPLKQARVYPHSMPSLVFEGFNLTRDFRVGGSDEGEAVFYAKSVEVIFDKASFEASKADIDDEKIWQIRAEQARNSIRHNADYLSEKLERRYYQLQNRIPFPPGGSSQDPQNAPAGGQQSGPAQ